MPVNARPFVGNLLTSDPVRYARNAAVLEAEPALGVAAPTISWADAAFRVMKEFSEHSYGTPIRQPLLLIGSGRDSVVSTQAIETFAMLFLVDVSTMKLAATVTNVGNESYLLDILAAPRV